MAGALRLQQPRQRRRDVVVARTYTRAMRRADVVWWVLLGVGFAVVVAMFVAIFILDVTPPPLLFAAPPAFGVAASLSRSWLRNPTHYRHSR
jgi:hypothetical protein